MFISAIMKYLGSKNRHAKEIIPIILKDRQEGQWFVDCFIGGANIIDKVNGNRIGADINPHLICLLLALQEGWIPPENLNEQEYKDLKNKQEITPLTAFAGFGCSFGGKWFGGFARGKDGNGNYRNFAAETRRNLLKQSPNLKGIILKCCNYLELEIPKDAIVYCDPPYFGTTEYRNKFNHQTFWDWCDVMVNKGHKVFVSEYIAPDGWNCIWEKKVKVSIDYNKEIGNSKENIEKLFTKNI